MFFIAVNLLIFKGELNSRINAINEELNARMSNQTTNSSNGVTTPSNRASDSNGSTGGHKILPTSTAAIQNAHQVQYCGPYKLEKTLGKGQTGKYIQQNQLKKKY